MSTDVTPIPPVDWDTYVKKHPAATAYHRSGAVSIGTKAFGLKTAFVATRRTGAIAGILPLVEQSSIVFGRFLVSLPFFTYGGLLADDEAAAVALIDTASDYARERRVDHLELRHSFPVPGLEQLSERLDKVSMVRPLPRSVEELSKELGSKLRSQIKRGDRENAEVIWGGKELLADFYQVFAAGMHSLGTPVYSRRFFNVVCDAMHGLIAIAVVRAGGAAQAAAILIRHGNRIEVPWAAATVWAKKVSLNMTLYWALLRYAQEAGAEAFDFGRSTVDSGTYKFKAQWGAKPQQLHWHYWLPDGRPIPQINHANRKYALAAAAWRKLPLWCANVLGPHIARSLP